MLDARTCMYHRDPKKKAKAPASSVVRFSVGRILKRSVVKNIDRII